MATNKSFLTEADIAYLEEKGEVVQYRAKDVIVHQQSTVTKLYFIHKGMVQIDYSRLYGSDVLAFLNDGDMIGEVSFMDHADTSATASAVEDVETLEVPREVLDEMIAADEGFAARFFRTIAMTLARRIRSQNRK
jgi:CRP-like cAMP-binding protein